MFRENFLKKKLEAGEFVLGTWAIIPSVITVDIMASAGLDFIIIDAEHGPISFETAQNMVIACESRGVSPVMRVGTIDESDILKALDIGVHAIQVPNVKSKEDIEQLIHYSKYPPNGNRGFSPFTRAGNYNIENSTKMSVVGNENTLVAVNIEGKEAIDEIDRILEIEDLDILFIGLFDLSKSLGIPGQVDDPKVINYLKELNTKITKAGKYTGTITTSEEKVIQFKKLGIKYIVHLVDCDMLRNSYAEVKDTFDNV
ncbi:MAG: aldolase [Balneola sp.]|nr:MAG: aldolase [Balneola sp.]